VLYILNTAAELRSHDADSLRLPPTASLRGDKREAHFTSFGARLFARDVSCRAWRSGRRPWHVAWMSVSLLSFIVLSKNIQYFQLQSASARLFLIGSRAGAPEASG